jgi:hypothetical protein
MASERALEGRSSSGTVALRTWSNAYPTNSAGGESLQAGWLGHDYRRGEPTCVKVDQRRAVLSAPVTLPPD